jgi:protein arginine N-methyltransferase 1
VNEKKLRRKHSSYYYYKDVKPCEVNYLLCKPGKVLSLDLETVEKKDIPKTLSYRKTVIRDGRMDGLYLYFKIIFDNEIFFDTSPLSRNTSWRIWVFRVEAREFKKGDVLEFDWVIDDVENIRTWIFSYKKV